MALGTLIALLLEQLGSKMRVLLSAGLIFVWAMPVVVAVAVWSWMVDYEFGVVNWLLTYLHVGNFNHTSGSRPPGPAGRSSRSLVVWGAIPFIALMVFAALTQVPQELVEAAKSDGATSWRVFRDVTVPLLKPIFVILTSLSIIWDFQVFNQIWILLNSQPPPQYFTMSIFAFTTSFQQSEYGLGAAIALVMVAILLLVSFVYIRQMVRSGAPNEDRARTTDRAERDRAARLRRDGVPRLLDGLDGVQARVGRSSAYTPPSGSPGTRRSRTSATRSTSPSSGPP